MRDGPWLKELIRHLLVLAGGCLIGWSYDLPILGAMTAAGILLGWHVLWLRRLERWLRTGRKEPLPDGSGAWPQVFARISRVDAERKAQRAQLRALLKELKASAKAYPDGVVVLNERREIVQYNRAARGLLGLKKRRDRGSRIETLLRHPIFLEYLESDHGSGPVDVPSPVTSQGWLTCEVIPYGGGDSLLLVRDTTNERRIEAIRRDFVANASHELRSPLTVLTGYLDALAEDDMAPADWQGPFSEMRRQAGRMGRLVDELLELSRLESAGPADLGEQVDVAALLTSVSKEVRSMPGCPATVNMDIESDANLIGDESDLYSVVSNLVSNAVRYTPKEGRIDLRWYADDSGGYLSIEDSGQGIPAELIPRLTERFFRVDDGRARDGGGTGLGLAIVRHALNRHDATLEIESTLGEGSIFRCRFPKKRIAA